MTEPEQNTSLRERARFWQAASGFWRGARAWPVWALCALLVLVVVLQLYVQFRFNYWNRDFFDALESRDPARLKGQAFLLVPLCIGSIALAVTSVWGRMTAQRQWREWLTGKVIDYWIEDDRYARLAAVQSERQIPEYRIAEDVRIATDAPIDLALGLVSSLLSAIIFIQVLWTVGGDIALPVGSHSVRLPGYLVIGVAVYSGIVTTAMTLVGAPLTRLVQIKNQAEAELITAAHQLRDIGEGVAPQGQRPEVCRDLRSALRATIHQWRRLCWQLMRTTIVSHGNSLLAPIIGLVLCAPKFLSGAMTLGELTQAAAAFTLVQASFNWVVDNYARIADWVSSLERVGGLLLSLDRLNRQASPLQPELQPLQVDPVKLP
ncbi:SbmA/BacA-like family transporter [Bradyrhizobium centrosematis]|uniref:SbmA/BacA-like family transporter n=1 Tax=Bradyrhizobium centrosematis TaxID=1300039 RepID=UPI00388D6D79